MRTVKEHTQAILSKMKEIITREYGVIDGSKQILKISNITYGTIPADDNYTLQKQCLDNKKTFGVEYFADCQLLDKATNKQIDSAKVKLGIMPTVSNRHSFILNGKEYIVHNQTRLRSGIYTKYDRNENPVVDFNLEKGKNLNIILFSAKQDIQVGVGGSHVTLYVFTHDIFGIDIPTTANIVGKIIHEKLIEKYQNQREKDINKLFDKLHFEKEEDEVKVEKSLKEKILWIQDYYTKTKMDPEINKMTVDKPISNVNKEAILTALKKLINVYSQKEDPSWRDNLAFKKIMGTEDFLEDKFVKRAKLLHAKLKPQIQKAKKISEIKLAYNFNSLLDEFFINSDLVNYPMQINPMEMIENNYKLTPLGEGGIGSTDGLPLDARNIHTSTLGFVDPVRTPDNIRAGIDNRAAFIVKKEGQTVKTMCLDKQGKIVYKSPQELFNTVYSLEKEAPDNMGLYNCFYQGKAVKKKKQDIEFFIKSDMMFTPTTLQIPFIEATHPQRAAMGAKMTTQAVSLTEREVPLVSTEGASFVNNHILLPKATVSGVITKIDKDKIIIKDSSGKEVEHNIPSNFPLNYTSFLDAKPRFKVGDRVAQGTVLADHNFSKDGKLALGKNLDIAFVPYKGLTFEDAIVVTETGAKKLTSEHLFNEELDISGGIETKKEKYISFYPNKFNVTQLNQLDVDGVVKKGTKVHNGDPLVLALRKKRESPEVLAIGKMSSRISNPYADESLGWYKDYPGEVIDVVKMPTHIKISIKATAPLVVGDKLCFDIETEVLTLSGWKPINEVSKEDKIYTLTPAGPKYDSPLEIHKYNKGGSMYYRKSDKVDMFVTSNHYAFGDFNPWELLDNFPIRVKVAEIYKKNFIFIKKLSPDTKEIFPELEYEWFLDEASVSEEGFIEDYQEPVVGITMRHENLYVRRNNKERFCGNSNRFGNKGVVSAIIPDSEAPRRPNGKIPDILFNPAGLPSRKNISQVFETVAAKVIKEKGAAHMKHKAFSSDNLHEELDKFMKEHKVSDTETLYDPVHKSEIPNIMTGTQYIYKLHKQAETSFAARAGGKYDIDMRPIKGGDEGAKSIGSLELYGFLAHNQGSRNLLREAATYKAEYNPEVWKNILSGHQPPPPKPTFVFEKFLTMLKGSGINVKRDNSTFKLAPLTDQEILEQSKGEIKEPKVVFGKPDEVTGLPFRPEPDGLFDPKVTGGLIGKNWAHISLPHPILNPVFEKPVRAILDITKTDLEDILKHKKHETVDGKDLTGGELIKAKLSKINVQQEIRTQQQLLDTVKSMQKKDKIHKKLKYLTALDKMGLKPQDAYTMSNVPVIPPAFRPIYPQSDGSVVTSDANYLYRDVIHAKEVITSPIIKALGPKDPEYGKASFNLYENVKKLQGLNKSESQKVSDRDPAGFLRTIIGNNQVKHGYFQSKLLARVQDIVARGVIAVAPSLKMDEIGLPEPMAWQLFGAFVIGHLIKNGYTHDRAADEVEKRTQAAKNILLAEMKERPVIAKRDPVLHKFGVMAFWPKLTQGIHIKVSPLVCKAFGADFDGDCTLNSVFWRLKKIDPNTEKIYNSSIIFGNGESNMPTQNKILQKEGLINLRDFPRIETTKKIKGNVEEYEVPEGIEVLTLDQDMQFKWLKPDFYTIHKHLEMINVKTNSGRSVQISTDHSLVTLDENLNLVKSNATLNMLVPVKPSAIFEHSINEIDLDIKENKNRRYTIKNQFKLNYDTGYFLGLIVGDGWASLINGRSDICLACITPEIKNRFEKVINEYIINEKVHIASVNNDHEYEGYSCRAQKLTWAAGDFALIVKDWVGHRAQNKHLPPFFLSSPISFRKGLLAGMIDTDGTININNSKGRKGTPQTNCSITTTSRVLAYEIVALSNSIGLTASVNVSTTPKGEECYNVFFSSEAVIKMKQQLILQHPKKAKNLKNSREDVKINIQKYGPPINKERMTELLKLVGCPRLYKKDTKILITNDIDEVNLIKEKRSIYNAIHDTINEKNKKIGHLNLDLCFRIVELIKDKIQDNEFWKKWISIVENKDLIWERITEITPIPEITEAYDLTIPPAYTMVTESGIVVYDTFTIHIPLTIDSIQDAKTMFPSKHLNNPLDKSPMHTPNQDAIIGLYLLTTPKQQTPVKTFRNKQEAMEAFKNGDIKINDKIRIDNIN